MATIIVKNESNFDVKVSLSVALKLKAATRKALQLVGRVLGGG